jgi:hypothetical protein
MASITLYGSKVSNVDLSTASNMSTATGGVETSSTTIMTGTNVYGEIWSQGNAGLATVTTIPGTPTGHGWVYRPGAGTFSNDIWSAVFTLSRATGFVADVTIRFSKYSSGSYSAIGTINTATNTSTKTVYTFSTTTMPATTFNANDLLYIELWHHDTDSNAGGDNPTVYISSSATQGVTDDLVVTTANFTASGTPVGGSTPTNSLGVNIITFSPHTTIRSADMNTNFAAINYPSALNIPFSSFNTDGGAIQSDGRGNLLWNGGIGKASGFFSDVLDATSGAMIFQTPTTTGNVHFQIGGSDVLFFNNTGCNFPAGMKLTLTTGSVSRMTNFTGTGSGTYNHNNHGIPDTFSPCAWGTQTPAHFGWDNVTTTQVHITEDVASSFNCHVVAF